MYAKAYKQESRIVIFNDSSRTEYHVFNANAEELDTCWTWTDSDCKSYLHNNTGNIEAHDYSEGFVR